jgi:hypothetical protein
MAKYIINLSYENYLIEKRNLQEKSFNFLNNREIKIENCTFIFLNKSKYSTSFKDFIKKIYLYMNSNIVIYLFHYDIIEKFINPFDLNSTTMEYLEYAFEYFNNSNYNIIKETDIIKFMAKYNYKNNYIINN